MKRGYGVGVGLITFGMASYAFLAIAARACGPERFGALSLLWLLTTTLGTGLFLPLEQELARFLADRGGRGQPAGAGVVTAARGGLASLALLAILTFVAITPLTSFFHGDRAVLLAVLANMVGQAVAYLSRGVTAGTERFHVYGAQLGLEGLLRVASAAGLALIGVRTAAPYGFALAASTVASVVVAAPATRALLHERGAPTVRSEVSTNVAWLVLAALASQTLANSTPVLVRLLGHGRDVATAQFFATLLVARIPLFLFGAVQAVLLPSLSRALAVGDLEGFQRSLRVVVWVVTGIGALSVLAGAAVGVPIVRLVFGPHFALSREDVVLLAAGTAVFIMASVQGQAALALGRHRKVATAWIAGCLLGLVVALLPGNVLSRVEWAFLLGSGFVGLLLALTVRLQLAVGGGTSNSAAVTGGA